MTGPNPTDAPELISIGAQSIVDRSKSLGLVWTRRLATVTDCSDLTSCAVLFDGDKDSVTAVSMVGYPGTGARVYVDMVPPSANFIVGFANDTAIPRRIIGRAESAANSAAVGAEAVVLTATNCVFGAGRAAAISINSDMSSSVANIGTYQIRKGTLAGTIWAIPWQGPVAVGAANNDGVNKTIYVRRAAAAGDLITDVVLTLAASAGTVTAQGGATFVRYLHIEDVGSEALFLASFAI
jgi:hypothetical protein